MSEWQWFNEFKRDARQRGDETPGRLLQIHEDGYQLRETDPDRALSLFAEGEHLAETYGHPWWGMLFKQWQVHGAIFYKLDYRNLLERAVQNLLTVRRPVFTGYPQRHNVARDLINIYQGVDPLGYEEEIQAAISYLEGECTPERYELRYRLQVNKINFRLGRDRLEEAKDLTLAALGWLEAEADCQAALHNRVDMTAYLAAIAFQKRDWAELAITAEVAEEAARQRGAQRTLATVLMWQAVTARHAADRTRAGRLYRSAQTYRGKLGRPPGSWFYNAWAYYHELAGSLPKVLEIRRQQHHDIRDKGMLSYECGLLTEHCRLLAALGELRPKDVEAAREAALRLRKPQDYLVALESAVAGKPTME